MIRFVSLALVVLIAAVASGGEVLPERDRSEPFNKWLRLSQARKKNRARAFVQSLTEDELVLASRQAHDHLVKEKDDSNQPSAANTEEWSRKGSYYLRDFIRAYFRKGVESNPAPFWELAIDKKLDPDFRKALIGLVGSVCNKRRRRAMPDHPDHVDILLGMMNDANEPFGLRRAAEDCAAESLRRRYYEIRKSQKELMALGLNEMLAVSSEAVSAETKKRIVLLAEKCNRFIRAVILLTREDLSFYERVYHHAVLAEHKKRGLVTDPAVIQGLDRAIARISLSEQDCIAAVQESYSEFIEKKSSAKRQPEHGWWTAAGYAAAGFVEHYFRTDPNRSPKPYLEMASDKSVDVGFRKALLRMLGEEDFYSLRREHVEVFFGSLLAIANDDSENVHLRKEARDALLRSVGRFYGEIRKDEPALSNIKHWGEAVAVPPEKISAENRGVFEALADVHKKIGKDGR